MGHTHGTEGWIVTNSTACIDGYYTGFVQWCGQDANDCVYFLKHGETPLSGLGGNG
ncbi:MAG: hypothetical protein WA364_30215 [Candidatus Nitrosopolaris sp.]